MGGTLFHGDLVASSRILYTPSSFAKGSLIYLQEIGQLDAQSPHVSRRSDLASYLFFVVQRGAGALEYQGRRFALSAGDCVFIDCKGGYSHSTSSDLWSLQWAHFFGGTMPGIFEKYLARGGSVVFHPESTLAFEQTLDRLYALAGSADHIRDMRINQELTALLTLLMEQSWPPENALVGAGKKQQLLQVREHLEQHFSEKITLDRLSEQFYMNKYYLAHLFKEQFGTTIGEYLLNLRITHAKQLLRFSSQTTETIAAACGMSDANYFARMFRRVEGLSPSEYRRLWRAG